MGLSGFQTKQSTDKKIHTTDISVPKISSRNVNGKFIEETRTKVVVVLKKGMAATLMCIFLHKYQDCK